MATPSLRGVGSGNTGSGTGAIVVSLPTHVAGDVLVVQLAQNTNATFSGITSGWTALRAAQASGTALTCSLYYKVAASSSETNPSFTPSKTLTWAACSAAFQGVDTIGPVGTPSSGTGATTGTSYSYGTLTAPGQQSCLQVVNIATASGTDNAISAGTGFTEGSEIDNGTTVSAWMGTRDALIGPAVPSAVSATGTASGRWVSQSYVLRSTEYATFRSATSTAGAAATSQTITKPTGALTDELLVLILHADSTTPSLTGTLNGWTQIGSANTQTSGANQSQSWLFYRRVAGGDGASYTSPVVSASAPLTAACSCYYRVPTGGTPLDGSPTTAGHTAATPVAIPSITTSVPNTTLIVAAGSWEWGTGWSGYTADMTERVDPATTNGTMMADEVETASGATGTRSVTPSSTGPHTLWMVAVKSTTSGGGGAISGTGSVTIRKPALAAVGQAPFIGTSTVTIRKPALVASGTEAFTGTAASTIRKPALAAVALERFTGSGTLTVRKPALAATATESFTSAGTLLIRKPALAATGLRGYIGTATLAIRKPVLVAAGLETFAGNGTLLIRKPVLIGVGASGDVIVGSATVLIRKPALAATALERFLGTATLTVRKPALAATGLERFIGTATVLIRKPALAAAGLERYIGTGALAVRRPVLTASALQRFLATGALTIRKPALAAVAVEKYTATATILIRKPVLASSGAQGAGGVGALTIRKPILASSGLLGATGSGALLIRKPALSSSGLLRLTGSSAILIAHPALAGTGVALLALTGSGAIVISGPLLHGTQTLLLRRTLTGEVLLVRTLTGSELVAHTITARRAHG